MSHSLVGDGKHDHDDEPKTGIARARRRVSIWHRCWQLWRGRNPGKAKAMIETVRAGFLLVATVVGSGWGAFKAINEAFLNPLHDLSSAIESIKSEQSVITKTQEEIKQNQFDNKAHVLLMQQRTSQYNEDIKDIKAGQAEEHKELQAINDRLNLHLIETAKRK